MFYTTKFTRKQRYFVKKLFETTDFIVDNRLIKINDNKKSRNGNRIVEAEYTDRNKWYIYGKAVCHENDKFNINKGIDIAVRKLLMDIAKDVYKDTVFHFNNYKRQYDKKVKFLKQFIDENRYYFKSLSEK